MGWISTLTMSTPSSAGSTNCTASWLQSSRKSDEANAIALNVPPRHFKSHKTSIAFQAWVLGHDPAKHILCVTSAQDLSDTFARASRKVMTSPFYQSPSRRCLSKGKKLQRIGYFANRRIESSPINSLHRGRRRFLRATLICILPKTRAMPHLPARIRMPEDRDQQPRGLH